MGGKSEEEPYESEQLLTDLGGCGKFQASVVILILVTAIPSFFAFQVDIFSIYNPGWKCVGNATSFHEANNMSTTTEATTIAAAGGGGGGVGVTEPYNTSDVTTVNTTNNGKPSEEEELMWREYGKYSCKAYEKCSRVEFSPDASTLLTEWGLACDKKWILSTMLSIRNAGNLCSVMVVGYVGDRFGRKVPFLLSRFGLLCISLAMYFCDSWKLYAGLYFGLGVVGSYHILVWVLLTEYMSPSWRIKIFSIPSFSLIAMLSAVLEMQVPDWRTLRLISVVSGFIGLIPLVIFIPESLRWLSVKGSRDKLEVLISKIARINKTELPASEKIESMVEKSKEDANKPAYSMIHLFRKGYRLPTTIIGFIHFSTDIIYFAFNFGMATLPGNFYVNLIIFSATDLPANLVAFIFANRYQRKPTMVCMFSLCSLCIFGIVVLDLTNSGGEYGITGLVMVSKLFLYVGWIVLATSQIELYPTVIRSTMNGFGSFCAALGGMAAPYLIPKDRTTFYIIYLCLAILVLLCTGLLLLFPETKGTQLKDRWGDDDDDNDDDEKGVKPVGDPEIFTIQNGEKKSEKKLNKKEKE